MNEKEIRTKGFTVRMIAENIVENVIHDNTTIDVDDILEVKEINKKLTKGNKYCVLVDSGMITSITKEGRELSASPDFQQNTLAKALFIRSLGHQLVANVYLQINKPAIRTKAFWKRDEAIEWLKLQVALYRNQEKKVIG